MIDAEVEACQRQVLVLDLRPFLPPLLKLTVLVPVPSFGGETFRGDSAGAQQDVAVGIVWIVQVQGDVRDHASRDNRVAGKVAQQSDLLVWGQLDRQGDSD